MRTDTVAGVSLLFLLAGCPSPTLLHTARPTPVGRTSWVIAPEAFGRDGVVGMGASVGYRRGLSKRMDWGLKAHTLGAAGDLNVLLFDTGGVAMSVDPTAEILVRVASDTVQGKVYGWLPVLLDVVSTGDLGLTIVGKGGWSTGNAEQKSTQGGSTRMLIEEGSTWLAGGGLISRIAVSSKAALHLEAQAQWAFDHEEIEIGGAVGVAW